MLAKAFEEAGIPAGVFNTTGGSEIGDYIIEHKEVNFHQLYRINPYRRTYYLAGITYHAGACGKDAALVLEDADLEHAAKQIRCGAFSYSGQMHGH